MSHTNSWYRSEEIAPDKGTHHHWPNFRVCIVCPFPPLLIFTQHFTILPYCVRTKVLILVFEVFRCMMAGALMMTWGLHHVEPSWRHESSHLEPRWCQGGSIMFSCSLLTFLFIFYLFTGLLVGLFACLLVCLFVYLLVKLFKYLFVHLFTSLIAFLYTC